MSSGSRAGGLDLDAGKRTAAILDEPQLKRLHGAILALSGDWIAAAQNAPAVIRALIREVEALRTALRRMLDALDRAGDVDGIATPEWIDGPDGEYPGGAVTQARAMLGAPERDPK